MVKGRSLRVSAENALFQQWMALRDNRSKRHRLGLFLVEGTTGIDAAVENGWEIDSLLYPAGAPISPWAQAHLGRGLARQIVEITEVLLGQLTSRHEGTELLAVVHSRTAQLSELPLYSSPWLVVVLDRPKSAGNVGTIIRTARSFGAQGLILTGHAADAFDPNCVRASVGALFSLPVVRLDSHRTVLDWIAKQKRSIPLTVVATGHRAPTYLHQLALDGNLVLLLGNETAGLSRSYQEACDSFARLPTDNHQSSLNVAAAAAAALYEVRRQRLVGSGQGA